jgi:probable HAF family extracellular repeat protein
MKIAHCFKAGGFILAATLFAGLGFITHAAAQESRGYFIDLNTGTATDLGSFGGGQTGPRALNDSGQVVGDSRTANGQFRPFITGPDGVGMRDIGTLGGDYVEALGINDAGQVVGHSSSSTSDASHAFITGPNGGGMRDLGIPADYSYARGINDAGQVAGSSHTANYTSHNAFITGANGEGITILGTLGGTLTLPSDINSEGQVAGYSFIRGGPPTYEGPYHGFITGANGTGMIDLGTLGGENSVAGGINDAGQVVGYSETANGQYHAFITGPDGVGMRDLGIPADYSYARAINDEGQVVGLSRMSGDSGIDHAFVTGPDGHGMTDLNSLVNLPDGVVLTEAWDINNVGQVIAVGVIPEPHSYAMLLAGLSFLWVFSRRRKRT